MVKRKKKTSSKKRRHKKRISEALAIVSLLINLVVLPGLGSLVGGRKKEGIIQLTLLFGGFFVGLMLILSIIGIPLGIPIIIIGPLIAWVWGIITGIGLIREATN